MTYYESQSHKEHDFQIGYERFKAKDYSEVTRVNEFIKGNPYTKPKIIEPLLEEVA